MSDDYATVPGFQPGDTVWPKDGPMALQHAPQTVIATWRSAAGADWLWLDRGTGLHPGSWYAGHWTKEPPSDAEIAARAGQQAEIEAENAELIAKHGGKHWTYPVG